jgi:hypothetical protein
MPDHLVVNFADTFVQDRLVGGDVVCYEVRRESFRWTAFRRVPDGGIGDIIEKNTQNNAGEELPVFVGVFAIGNAEEFRLRLMAAVANRDSAVADPFYVALRDYFNDLPKAERVLQAVVDWRDFGHVDTYASTKQKFIVNARFFNHFSVDSRRGVLRKTSSNAAKLVDEIHWYLKLPKGLQHLAPRVFDYSVEFKDAFLELEYYGYPTLSDVFLYGRYDSGTWFEILTLIGDLLDLMRSYRLVPADAGEIHRALKEMYLTKTLKRLAAIEDVEALAPFWVDELMVNGKSCLGLQTIRRVLPDVLLGYGLYDLESVSIIHGDLCLSNILYDHRNGVCRLIDPRGRFGPFDIYGDPRYDLAKIAHSFESGYDFFVNDQFDLEWSEGRLSFATHANRRHNLIVDCFHDWFVQRLADSYPLVRVVESLLFLSMVPLHADRPRAQQALLGRGIELFTAAAEQNPTVGI